VITAYPGYDEIILATPHSPRPCNSRARLPRGTRPRPDARLPASKPSGLRTRRICLTRGYAGHGPPIRCCPSFAMNRTSLQMDMGPSAEHDRNPAAMFTMTR
jgi:hypothetical protein